MWRKSKINLNGAKSRMKLFSVLFLALLMAIGSYSAVEAVPADENYEDDSGYYITSNFFILDGIKYIVTGEGGVAYYHEVYSGTSNRLGFNMNGDSGMSEVRVEAADGSSFRLMGLDIYGGWVTPATITIRANNGASYSQLLTEGQLWRVDLSGDSQFYNITSFTISGNNLAVDIDNLDFDIPNFPPEITSNGGGSTGSASVLENTTAVTTVTAIDSDVDDVLTYSIIGGADAALFTLDANTGILTFNAAPDYEFPADSDGNNQYQVIVQVTDGIAADSQNLYVVVMDVNEAPVLSATAVNPDFSENGLPVKLFADTVITAIEPGQTIEQITLTVDQPGSEVTGILTVDGTDITLDNGNSVTTAANGLNVTVSVTGNRADVTIARPGGISVSAARNVVDNLSYHNTSDALIDGTRVITLTGIRDNGGTANGGIDTATLSGISSNVTVFAENDAPMLSDGPYGLPATNEDTASGSTLVSTILAGLSYTDPDPDDLAGVAVIGLTGNGTWQYSTNGTVWTNLGSVSNVAALLLSADTQVRYLPDGENGEIASLTFQAWDQTSGSPSADGLRYTTDTTITGSTAPFSSGTAQARLTVTSVNDAPVLFPVAPNLMALTDSDVNNPGQKVGDLVGMTIVDVDAGAVKGIAITGMSPGTGVWQYSTDGGASWTDCGNVNNMAALLLREEDRIRFVPDQIHGTTADFTYRAWDQSGASAGLQGTKVAAGIWGGTTPFSVASDTASVTVTEFNDPPVVTTSGGSTVYTEGAETITSVAVDGLLTLTDPDSTTLVAATVSITGNFQPAQDRLAFNNDGSNMGNITGSYDSAAGVLILISPGRTATVAQWQAALRAVTYSNTSDAPDTATRTISISVNDGSADSPVVTKAIVVIAVNDAPTVKKMDGATGYVREDNISSVYSIYNSIMQYRDYKDPDGSGLSGMAIIDTQGNGTWQYSKNYTTWYDFGPVSPTNALLLPTETYFRYVPDGKNGEDASFTWRAWDQSSGTPYTTAGNDTTVNGGTSAYSSVANTLKMPIWPVNDGPTITAPATLAIDEDVITPLTGISFADVDAGSASVTVTLSVPSGTLHATSGSGVTAAGSGTGSLTLTGSIANINTFIENGSIRFITESNATHNVILQIVIDDGGNTGEDPGLTGTGSSEAAETTVTLLITAINDAPVNIIPDNVLVEQDHELVFSVANGNQIAVSDPDAGSGLLQVTLTADHGWLTLSSFSGLSFLAGDGSGDVSMTFTGRLEDINNALNGMVFTPTPGYSGAAMLTITSDDQGSSGSGDSQTDTDMIRITVYTVPAVTSVSSASPNRSYRAGEVINVTVDFDLPVIADTSGGTPYLQLKAGIVPRNAVYISGSGTRSLSFGYTVQAGDSSADLDYTGTGALVLNGGTIRNIYGIDAALALPAVGGADSLGGRNDIVIDGIAPSVVLVWVPANGTYVTGQNLDFRVVFDENVTVSGTPKLPVTIGSRTVNAAYVSGSGTNTLLFRYTVAAGDEDKDGISLGAALLADGGSLQDAVGNDAALALNGVGITVAVRVDAAGPKVNSVAVPADGIYVTGQNLDFRVVFDENVTVSGTPKLPVTIGSRTVNAAYVSGSGTNTLLFRYTVADEDEDKDGISLGATLLADGGRLQDAVGNDAALALNGVGITVAVWVDTVAPRVTSVTVPADGVYTAGQTLEFTVNYDETVLVDTTGGRPSFPITLNAGRIVQATYVSGSGTTALVFRYTVVTGDQDNDGISVGNAILLNGGSLRDNVGNNADLALDHIGDTSGVRVSTTVVSENTVTDTAIVGNTLIVTLDSADYDSIQILINGRSYGSHQTVTASRVYFDLPAETGSYQITIRVVDRAGNYRDFTTLYQVRVKYVPGRGDGFGWEMWK